jgi:hypothetical protein
MYCEATTIERDRDSVVGLLHPSRRRDDQDKATLDGCVSELKLHSGWRIRYVNEPTGRDIIEIYDVSCDLVGFVASASRPLISIDAAWRGHFTDDSGRRQWWALAIGHAPVESAPLVTFGSRSSSGQLRRTTVAPTVGGGLWGSRWCPAGR